jgi:hypothetical protein
MIEMSNEAFFIESGSSPTRRRSPALARTLTLTARETLAIHRARNTEGLICIECGRLLAIRPESFSLPEDERLNYRCAECRQEESDREQRAMAITARFAQSRTLAQARRLRPPLIVSGESETHDPDSHAFAEAVAAAEVGGWLPCERCAGSHVAADCGYSDEEAEAVQAVRRPRIGDLPTVAVSRSVSPHDVRTGSTPSRTRRSALRGGTIRPIRPQTPAQIAATRANLERANAARRQKGPMFR